MTPQPPADADRPPAARIAIFLPSLAGGGVGRSMLDLAGLFVAAGHQVDLVLCRLDGAFRDAVPAGVRVVPLEASPVLPSRLRILAADPAGWRPLLRPVLLPFAGAAPVRFLPDLVAYLRREQPDAMLAAKTHTNLVAIWARRLAGVPTRLVVSERSNLSSEIAGDKGRKWRWRAVAPLLRRTYSEADAIVAVSNGVADDLAATTGLDRAAIRTVYNPVVGGSIARLAAEPVAESWFGQDIPVVLAAGRLTAQKDFPTLLRAFARLRQRRAARLVILGEGSDRPMLARLARDLGVSDDVEMPGFRPNPFAYMGRAACFVLSSTYEGLPGVLIQALACGCPVVSTDCPSGPAEILDGGRFGALVAVGDDAAMADAIAATLDSPLDPERLRSRAALFSAERSVRGYLDVLIGQT